MEDKQFKDKLPNPELRSPAPALPEDLAQDIPHCHSTWIKFIHAHLLNYHCYTALNTLHEPHTYHETSTDPLWQIAMKEKLATLSKNHTWDLVTLPLGNLWLVVSRSTRLRLALMGPLSATKLVLLQNILYKIMGLIIKRPLLWLLVSHLFVSS